MHVVGSSVDDNDGYPRNDRHIHGGMQGARSYSQPPGDESVEEGEKTHPKVHVDMFFDISVFV